MESLFEAYAKTYSSMLDDDLQRLSLDIKSLTPEARSALRLEMEVRHLPIDGLDWAAQPEPQKVEDSSGGLGLFLRNLGIFILCDAVYGIVIGILLSNVNGIDSEKLGGILATFLLNLSMLLAFLTSKYFVPRKVRTVWIIGAIVPPCVFLLVLIFK
jgi:hypothetical protein